MQRAAGCRVGQAGAGQGRVEEPGDEAACDHVVLGAGPALEQQRGRRHPGAFVPVPAADQRHGSAGVTDPADDGAEHVGEFGADDQEPFGVGLGRRDLQQRDQFAGAGQPVLDEAVVGELEQLLGPDAGMAENFDDRPCPERVVFLEVEVPLFAARGITCPDASGRGVRPDGPDQGLPGGGELLAGLRRPGGGEQRRGVMAPLGGGAGQDGQHGQPLPGPGVHPGFAAAHELPPGQVFWPDRPGRHPRAPPGGIFQGPFGQVQVEGPDAGQDVEIAEPLHRDRGPLTRAGGGCLGPGRQSLLPAGGGLAGQAQRADARLVPLQVRPEAAGQLMGAVVQGHVVDGGPAFLQVADDQVPDGPAGDRVTVDQFLHRALPGVADFPQCGHAGPEDAHLPQHPERRRARA